jgi:short-subunit dehydrogenase
MHIHLNEENQMNTFTKNYGDWALITGASSGIGLDFARQIAAKGLNVVLTARSEDKLKVLASSLETDYSVKTRVVVADLADPTAIARILAATADISVGLLVNNAGREDSGPFLEIPIEDALQTIDLNIKAPVQLTQHFATKMQAKGNGGIIFMSSIVAFQGVPNIANYAATKAYDLVFAEGVAAELKRSNIDVISVNPGFTDSELSPQISFDGLPIKPMAAEAVAQKALNDLGTTRVSVPGMVNKFLYYTGKYVQPRRLNTAAFGFVFRKVLRNKLRKHGGSQQSSTYST